MRISVVVPSFNSHKTIGKTLDALKLQTREDLLCEAIVVDSSTDGVTPAFLAAREGGKVRVIRAGERVMPAVGRNIGAREAAGDLLVFVDSDAFMANDCLERIAAHAGAGRRVGGGSIALPYFQKSKAIAWAQYFLQFNEFMDAGGPKTKPFAPSCNLYCETALFREVGGFPEIRASEDVLFGLKVSARTPFWFVPDAKVYHIFREEWGAFLKNQVLLGRYVLVYRRMRSRSALYSPLAATLLLPLFLGAKFARIAARILFAKPAYFTAFLGSLPAFLLGLGAWAAGFAKAALSRDGFEPARAVPAGPSFSHPVSNPTPGGAAR